MNLWFDILYDLALLLAAAVSVLGLRAFFRKRYMRPAVQQLRSLWHVRLSFYIIVFYFGAGFLDLLVIPGKHHNNTVLDFLFSGVPQERTYSAPLARRMTGVKPGTELQPENQLKGRHLLGTDINGYDVFYKVLKGARTALLLAMGSTLISFPIGILLGMLAGYFGGWVDDIIVWLYTTVASIPWILFAVAFLSVFGRSLFWICVAFGITGWVGLARLLRGETLKHKSMDYIQSAVATGIPRWRILLVHLLPNLFHLVLITFSLSASSIILAESVLTFIGIGVEPGTDSWGIMLTESQQELTRSPVVYWIFAGSSFLGILPLVLCLNLLGDALRDALDPRTAHGEGKA